MYCNFCFVQNANYIDAHTFVLLHITYFACHFANAFGFFLNDEPWTHVNSTYYNSVVLDLSIVLLSYNFTIWKFWRLVQNLKVLHGFLAYIWKDFPAWKKCLSMEETMSFLFVKLFLFKVQMAIVKLTWQHIWLRFKLWKCNKMLKKWLPLSRNWLYTIKLYIFSKLTK